MTPNMCQLYTITWLHEKETFRIGHNEIFMHAYMTLTPRMQNRKQFTFDVHFNDDIAIDVTQTSPITYLLIYLHFIY